MRLKPRAELSAFFRFLAAPRPLRQGNPIRAGWAVRAAFFAALALIASMPLVAIIVPVTEWAGLKNLQPDTPNALFVVGAVLLGPFLEELLFRAGLRLPVYTLYIGPWLCLLLFDRHAVGLAVAGALVLLAFVAVLLHWQLALRKPGGGFKFARRFVAHYGWIFWTHCALFAIAHAVNFEWQGWRGTLVPLGVLPQFLSGAIFGYLRLRDGLRSSVLAHMLMNATWVTLYPLGH